MSRLSLLLISLALAGPASAAKIFINGVKVDGAIYNQTFKDVSVRFDEKGDVFIKAPGVRIEQEGGQPASAGQPTAAPAKPKNQYWFVLNAEVKGQYKVLVSVNGQATVTVPSSSPQYVKDLTSKMRAGKNEIKITFLPEPTAKAPAAAKNAVEVLIGVGHQAQDGTLTIHEVLGSVKQPTGRVSAEAHVIEAELTAASL